MSVNFFATANTQDDSFDLDLLSDEDGADCDFCDDAMDCDAGRFDEEGGDDDASLDSPRLVLPDPTPEQDAALDLWRRGLNQTVTACAGAGKSTFLLQAVLAAPAHSNVVILSYNRPLATSMNAKLERLRSARALPEGVRAAAFTFHGLASHVWKSLAPDDTSLTELLRGVQRGKLSVRADWKEPTHVAVDESQDLRPLHAELLRLVVPPHAVVALVGDQSQLLYDYEDPPASVEYMEAPQTALLSGDWSHRRLTVSFRLTALNAAFVNAVGAQHGMPPLVAGGAGSPVPARVLSTSVWQWTERVLPVVLDALSSGVPPDRIGIIARSVRTSQPLRALVNSLARQCVPVYLHGCDGAHPRVRTGKVCVSTWHASKGLEFLLTVVLGVDGTSEPRPLHVALTRAQEQLVVVQDARAPSKAVLHAIAADAASVAVDARTAELVQTRDQLADAGAFQPGSGARDVTAFSPRGGAAMAMHELILDVGGDLAAEGGEAADGAGEHLARLDGVWEDVSPEYLIGVLMAAEVLETGRCRRLQEMRLPKRASRQQRIARLMSGDRTRVIDGRLSDFDLLPNVARAALDDPAPDQPADGAGRVAAKAFCTAAAVAGAFDGFHHRARRLLRSPERWVREDVFQRMLDTARIALPRRAAFDGVVARHARVEGERPLYCRVHARAGDTAVHFVYGDRVMASDRTRAAVPLALDEQLRRALVINLRTGECQALALADPAAFAAQLQAA